MNYSQNPCVRGGGIYACAVEDSGAMYYDVGYAKKVQRYFNSGVMLLNLQKMREHNMTERLIQTKRDLNDSSLMDQNVFNLVFDGHVRVLPVHYNFLPSNLYRANQKWTIEQLNEKYGTNFPNKKALYADAAIVHYSSKDKPWKEQNCPCADSWLEVYLKTPVEHTLLTLPAVEEKYSISVIIPCYNVENYLEETMDSLLNQSFQNFEVICLDDGSTDRTLDMLREYEKKDDRVRVATNINHGQGWERNLGIQMARGKYIYFFDSDDLLEKTALERMFTCAGNNRVDYLMFEGDSFYEENALEELYPQYKWVYCRKEAIPTVLTGEAMYVQLRNSGVWIVQPCMQMSRREYLLENRIVFPELPMHEDNLFTFQALRPSTASSGHPGYAVPSACARQFNHDGSQECYQPNGAHGDCC